MRFRQLVCILMFALLISNPCWAQFKDSSIPQPKESPKTEKPQQKPKAKSAPKASKTEIKSQGSTTAKPKGSFRDQNLLNPKLGQSQPNQIPSQPDLTLQTQYLSPIGLDLNIYEVAPDFQQFLAPLLPMRVRVFAHYMDLYTLDRYFSPTPIVEKWNQLDNLVKYLSAMGCHITLVINTDVFDTYFQPDEPTAKKMETRLPSDEELWLSYSSKLIERYSYAVSNYQVLVDVNLTAGITKEKLYEYLDIVKVLQVKHDPSAELWLGSIRGFDLDFIYSISSTPFWGLIDGVGFALYPFYDGIEEVSRVKSPISHFIGDAKTAVQLCKARGKKISVTGLGFSTITTQSFGQVEQASAIARSVFLLQSQGIDNVYISNLIDKAEWSTYPGNHLGILMFNGQPKASFYAIQRLINSLKGAQLSEIVARNITVDPSKTVAITKTYYIVYTKPNQKVDVWFWTNAVHPEPLTVSMWIYLKGYIPYSVAGLLDEYAQTPSYKATPNSVLMVGLPLQTIPTQISIEARGASWQ